MKITDKYVFMSDGILLQSYPSEFIVDDILFENSEKYMIYQKALLFNDYNIAKEILAISDPIKIKELGRQISNFNRDVWDVNCFKIVYTGNLAKFKKNEILRKYLLSYGNRIIVYTSNDKIWGIGMEIENDKIHNPSEWMGMNLLGNILTNIKHELQNELQHDII